MFFITLYCLFSLTYCLGLKLYESVDEKLIIRVSILIYSDGNLIQVECSNLLYLSCVIRMSILI